MALGTDCFYKKPYESQMPPTLTKTDQVAAGIAFQCSLARVETQNDGISPALPHPSGRSRCSVEEEEDEARRASQPRRLPSASRGCCAVPPAGRDGWNGRDARGTREAAAPGSSMPAGPCCGCQAAWFGCPAAS